MSLPPLPSFAHPGLPLGPSTTYAPGSGTHLDTSTSTSSLIYASRAGRPTLFKSSPAFTSTTTNTSKNNNISKTRPTVSIPRLLPSPTHARIPSRNVSNKNTLPEVGCVVLARVLRVRSRGVDVGVVVVYPRRDGGEGGKGGKGGDSGVLREEEEGGNGDGEDGGSVCGEEWAGVIRREDVRATEKDRVVCGEGFRVGDVVRGVVISLGDQSNYYLTTAKNELGVIMAKSEAGNTMVPISWREFRDPVTGLTESRKVAKPF